MPPENQRRNNRIEIDLKVLKDKEMDRLSEFSTEFSRSVMMLSTTLGDYSTQLKAHARNISEQMGAGFGTTGIAATPRGAYGSAHAEKIAEDRASFGEGLGTAKGSQSQPRQRSDEDVIAENRERMRALFLQSKPSLAGSGGGSTWTSKPASIVGAIPGARRLGGLIADGGSGSYASVGLNMVEESQFSLGSFGEPTLTNVLQQASYRLGNRAYERSPITGEIAARGTTPDINTPGGLIDESGNMRMTQPSLGVRAAMVGSEWTGTAARAKIGFDQTIMPIARHVGNYNASRVNSGAQQLGYDIGADSAGGWQAMTGLRWTTEGGRRATAMRWTDRMAALSPGWSGEDQAELGGALRGMGIDYGKGWGVVGRTRGNDVSELMQSTMRSTGMDANTLAEEFDRRRRYDPTAMASFKDDMEAMSKAARAAGMSVDAFAQASAAASAAIISSTGMSASSATTAVTTGAAMGLVPEQVARLQNRDLGLRALATDRRSGGDAQYSEIMRDPSKTLQQTQREVASVAGFSLKEMQEAGKNRDRSKADSQRYEAMRSQLEILYQDPSTRETIFQGMTPDQLLASGDSKEIARGSLSNSIADSLRSWDAGGKVNQLSTGDFKKQMKSAGFTGDQMKEVFNEDGNKKEWEKAQAILAEKGADDTNHVKIDLTSRAAKLIKKLDGDDDVSRRNLKGYAAEAMSQAYNNTPAVKIAKLAGKL